MLITRCLGPAVMVDPRRFITGRSPVSDREVPCEEYRDNMTGNGGYMCGS